MTKNFNIKNKVLIITGGAGLLGSTHVEAIADLGEIPILFDKNLNIAKKVTEKVRKKY